MILQKYSDIPEFNDEFEFYFISSKRVINSELKDDILLCGYEKAKNEISVYRLPDDIGNLQFLFSYPVMKNNVDAFLKFIENYKNIDIFKMPENSRFILLR